MERRKWYIRMMESGYDAGSTTYEGTLEEAKKYAREWASEGDWLEPVVKVWVEVWNGDPYEDEGAECVEVWCQYSRDPSKPDPYQKAEEAYIREHEGDECPVCGRVGPEIHTPGLGSMKSYLEWHEVEPHAYLGWCRCPCGHVWGCVDERHVEELAKRAP